MRCHASLNKPNNKFDSTLKEKNNIKLSETIRLLEKKKT